MTGEFLVTLKDKDDFVFRGDREECEDAIYELITEDENTPQDIEIWKVEQISFDMTIKVSK